MINRNISANASAQQELGSNTLNQTNHKISIETILVNSKLFNLKKEMEQKMLFDMSK